MRRLERQGKRPREPEPTPAAPPLKHPKLDPNAAPSQQIKQEPTAGPLAAAAVANGGSRVVKQEGPEVKPEGAAAVPLQPGGPGNQRRYEQLQQHAAHHQQQQQQPAKPLRQVGYSQACECTYTAKCTCSLRQPVLEFGFSAAKQYVKTGSPCHNCSG